MFEVADDDQCYQNSGNCVCFIFFSSFFFSLSGDGADVRKVGAVLEKLAQWECF